jgi:hypothetical protein
MDGAVKKHESIHQAEILAAPDRPLMILATRR